MMIRPWRLDVLPFKLAVRVTVTVPLTGTQAGRGSRGAECVRAPFRLGVDPAPDDSHWHWGVAIHVPVLSVTVNLSLRPDSEYR
jgi:hypothetical protein